MKLVNLIVELLNQEDIITTANKTSNNKDTKKGNVRIWDLNPDPLSSRDKTLPIDLPRPNNSKYIGLSLNYSPCDTQ